MKTSDCCREIRLQLLSGNCKVNDIISGWDTRYNINGIYKTVKVLKLNSDYNKIIVVPVGRNNETKKQ